MWHAEPVLFLAKYFYAHVSGTYTLACMRVHEQTIVNQGIAKDLALTQISIFSFYFFLLREINLRDLRENIVSFSPLVSSCFFSTSGHTV